ncbi:hypothetical protein [Microvirga alba]|uniref:Uncharacterized protein n=1 Tax=Microvirga alba TaxID=2791025 RepID=A0A931FQ35_9HYPH|nr:hypothetical protein [Microvirga alba]MBF9235430.1 hypothetical protein [Microvirga alba]
MEALDGDRLFTDADTELERDFWLKKPRWTLEQAIAISFGRDPRYVNWTTVEPYASSSNHAYEYYKRRLIVLDTHAEGYLPDPIPSAEFIRWTLRINLHCDVGEYELYGHAPPSWPPSVPMQSTPTARPDALQTDPKLTDLLRQTQAECARLEARVQQLEQELELAEEQRVMKAPERSALTMLVYAMARGLYGYDPSRLKGDATSKILRALDRFDLSLDEKTIRKYLRQAHNEVQKLKPRENQD